PSQQQERGVQQSFYRFELLQVVRQPKRVRLPRRDTRLPHPRLFLLLRHVISLLPIHSPPRSEEHTSELQSRFDLVCRLLLEKKKTAHAPSTDNPQSSNLSHQP